jgi:hypothetical protein
MQYLVDKLRSGTASSAESQELQKALVRETEEAKRKNNTDALVAILGLIALLYILNQISKK